MQIINILKRKLVIIIKKILGKESRAKFNERIRKEMYNPDKMFLDLKFSDKVLEWYKELNINGILKIENEFKWVQKEFKKEYFEKENNKFMLKDLIDERSLRTGRVFAKAVSLNDPKLYNWYFNNDLILLLGKMYKQQPYYRNQPIIQTYSFTESHTDDIAGKWHIDGGLNQITFMLLINDITENDTHMQYALKSSNKKHKELDRNYINVDNIESDYEIIKCIGKAGTLYVFQGGIGLHRAVYKRLSTRSIYHVNFTPGHDIQNEGLQKINDMPDLDNEPFYVKRCSDLIIS